MFKPGDIVKVRALAEDHQYTVLPWGTGEGLRYPLVSDDVHFPIRTSGGVFSESELMSADPTVLMTYEGKKPEYERKSDFLDRIKLLTEGGPDLFLSRSACEKIEKSLRGSAIDYNGHWKGGTILYEEFRSLSEDFSVYSWSLDKADGEALAAAIDSGVPLDHWVPIELGPSVFELRTCPYCAEKRFCIETNGFRVRLGGAPCIFANGFPPSEWELNVPSGKLAVANDLRELFPVMGEDFDINTTMGCRQTALAYAEVGLAHAYVGNSCPSVYECKDGTFKIANKPCEDWDEETDGPAPKFEGKKRAFICTDLWWYSIADAKEYKRRLKRFNRKSLDFRVTYVNVKPGVYRFRHDEEARRNEGPGECVYTRFEWVREPDPVKDLLSLYDNADIHPHGYVHRSVQQWPTLYGKEVNNSSWQRVADHVLCTIGNGVEWHERGFPRAKVDPTIPDVDPPSFRRQLHWYPFSENYSAILVTKLSPSFAKLAFRVLESIISFGTTLWDSPKIDRAQEIKQTRERMQLAVKRYSELAQQYPELADPDYVEWLSNPNRVNSWVADFPFSRSQ